MHYGLTNTEFYGKIVMTMLIVFLFSFSSRGQWNFTTDYFSIHINKKGFITSMKNITVKPNREFSLPDKPSPLLSLYDSNKAIYYEPVKAHYDKAQKIITLNYSNGSVARISLVPQNNYFRLTLRSLAPRTSIDGVQWGSYHTSITNLLGEIIGVASDTTEAVNFAIGMLALDDNTLGGTSETIADAAPFQYIIHSPDSMRFSLPAHLHEGQVFTLGGDGISDVAFYAHKGSSSHLGTISILNLIIYTSMSFS